MPNNTLELTVNQCGRLVLAMDCALGKAQWRSMAGRSTSR